MANEENLIETVNMYEFVNEKYLLAKTKKLIPESKKNELIKSAETNILGEPVRFYRMVGSGEVAALLSGERVTPLTSPTIYADFDRNKDWLLESLKRYSNELSSEFQRDLPKILDQLGTSPTLEEFMQTALKKIPRFDLFKLHVKQQQYVNNYYGLMSVSVGIPILPPNGFKKEHDSLVGSCVAELVIPNNALIVNPPSGGLRETEKEVNTLEILPEWLVDLYVSAEDFADRFIAQPGSPLEKYYKELIPQNTLTWVPHHAHDLLMRYKREHPLEDLVPLSKIPETDINNPIHMKPIL